MNTCTISISNYSKKIDLVERKFAYVSNTYY
jgi:hypothetical protein